MKIWNIYTLKYSYDIKKLNHDIFKEWMDIETILFCVATQNRSFIWGGGKQVSTEGLGLKRDNQDYSCQIKPQGIILFYSYLIYIYIYIIDKYIIYALYIYVEYINILYNNFIYCIDMCVCEYRYRDEYRYGFYRIIQIDR